MITLIATKRSKNDKLADIRKGGMVPAVVYGASVENTPISVPSIDFAKILKIAGESSTIVLEIKEDETKKDLPVVPAHAGKTGVSKKVDVLIHEVQVDPVKGNHIHVDFLAIDVNKPVQVTVPLEFVGIAPAEKDGLGILVKVLHEVEIEALPKDLPHNIEVNLSTLIALDDQIHLKNLTLSKGVTLITDKEEVVALIAPIKEDVLEEAPVDLSAIEVEKKGKKEENQEETKSKEE